MRWNTSATSPATERMLVPCQDEQVSHSGDVEDPGGKVTKDMRNRCREAERGPGLLPWQAVVPPVILPPKSQGAPPWPQENQLLHLLENIILKTVVARRVILISTKCQFGVSLK